MMDYSFFDSLIDAVFVIDAEKKIWYCNNSAASLCNSSVRRLSRGVPIFEVIELSDQKLFATQNGTWGEAEATPFTEIDYRLLKEEKSGKVQVAIQPFSEPDQTRRWVVMIHDVTLEETLHGKYRGELEQKEEYINQLRSAQKELENYSKNLEQMVEERTREVKEANQMLNAIMNSLGQGFLVFDKAGKCGRVFTKACEEILQAVPEGKTIQDILRTEDRDREQFNQWLSAVFSEMLPFDVMKDLAPKEYKHTEGKKVTLEYYPIRSEQGEISNLVLVGTDRTAEFAAAEALEKERQHARMIVKVARARDQFRQFLKSFYAVVARCEQLADEGLSGAGFKFEEAYRLLHTLEGEAAAFSAWGLRTKSRESQEILEPLKWGELDRSVEIAGKFKDSLELLRNAYHDFLVDNRSLFDALGFSGEQVTEIPTKQLKGFGEKLRVEGAAPNLRMEFEQTFLTVSLKKSLQHYEEVAQMVAERLGKRLAPVLFEGDVRVNPERFEGLISVLVHVFRNAVDHGLETTEERSASGKSEDGHIWVRLDESDELPGFLRLEVGDDGKGIDPKVIREKFSEKFPQVDISQYSDLQLVQLIFYPGFSSRDAVSDFSGRGIGMDAVRAEVEKLGGQTRVESTIGRGSRIIIEVPLSSIPIKLAAGA